MKYVVKRDFADLHDNGHVYRVGDAYPHPGVVSSEERVKELETGMNRLGVPLIEAVAAKPKRRKKDGC